MMRIDKARLWRLCLVVLILSASGFSKCSWGKNEQSQYSQVNWELSNGLRSGAETLQDIGKLDPTNQEKAKVIAMWAQRLLPVVRAHKAYLKGLEPHLDKNDKLVLSGSAQVQLARQLQLLSAAARQVVKDPEIIKLDPIIADHLDGVLQIIPQLVERLLALLPQLPHAKVSTPTLRQQLERETVSSVAVVIERLTQTEDLLAGLGAQ